MFSFIENRLLICVGFSCYWVVSCVVMVGVVIRMVGVIVVNIMMVVSSVRLLDVGEVLVRVLLEVFMVVFF